MKRGLSCLISILSMILISLVMTATDGECSDSGCDAESTILNNGYIGACGYTDFTSFTLSEDTFISRIRIWYDTGEGGESISAGLTGPDGFAQSSGSLYRGSCQWSWCEALWDINMKLSAGSYYLMADSNSICDDPSGKTTLILYGCTAENPDDNPSDEGIDPPGDVVVSDYNSNSAGAPVYMGTMEVLDGKNSLKEEMELSINFPAYNSGVDIWIAILLPDGRFYVVDQSGSVIPLESKGLVPITTDLSGTVLKKTILEKFEPGSGTGPFTPWPEDGPWVAYWLVAPNSQGDILKAIDSGKYELGFYTFNVKKKIPTNENGLTIKDYYPKSGAAGSYIFLKMADDISTVSDTLEVLYDQETVDKNRVIRKGEDILQITLPDGADSGYIQLKSGDKSSNQVYFTVSDQVTTQLYSQSVSPSSENQTLNYNNEIYVTIPPGILDRTRTLTISKVENPPGNSISPLSNAFSFDISIDGLEQLNDFIEIKVRYDSTLLSSEYPSENQLVPMRWNEDEKYWYQLPYRVDETDKTLSFYTDHLTLMEWVVIGTAAVATIPVTWAGEKLLNDVYVTTEGNFRILYSRSAIDSDAVLSDSVWTTTTYKSPIYPISSYRSGYPKFIQDMGKLLETALASYVTDKKFKDPITKPGWLWGTSKNPITVKMDSWWVSLGGDPNYEKVWENIHFPTEVLKDYTKFTSYTTLAHELFHRIEAEYYGITGFKTPANLWWLEATAEYAGNRAAWPGKLFDNMNEKTGYDFLSYPISNTGKMENKNGWSLDQSYEYAASTFVQFLVEKKGMSFNELVKYISEGSPLSSPVERLNGYKDKTLSEYYREFCSWAVFGNDSFLKKYSIETIAEQNDSLSVSGGEDSEETESVVKISFSGGNFSTLNIFRSESAYERAEEIPSPIRTIASEEVHELQVKSGDHIYLLANNTGSADEEIYVSMKTVVNGEEKPGVTHTFSLKGGYSAKLWTVLIACRYQEVTGSSGAIMKDSVTGLEWQRCSVGQTWNQTTGICEGTRRLMSASDAFDLTEEGGWRTPTRYELSTLQYCSEGDFSVDESWFWSSSWWEMCVGDTCQGCPSALSYKDEVSCAEPSQLLPVRLVREPN